MAFGGTNLTSAGVGDAFIAKLTSAGAWSWAVRGGSAAGNEYGYGAAIDPVDGSVVAMGTFPTGTSTFGTTNLVNSYSGNYMWVAKLTSAGAWSWAVGGGHTSGSSNMTASSRTIGIGADSAVTVAARYGFANTAAFGSTNLTARGGTDVVVARLTSAGAWSWVAQAGGWNNDACSSVTVNSDGTATVLGDFYGGRTTIGSSGLTASSGTIYGVFTAKVGPPWLTGTMTGYPATVTMQATGSTGSTTQSVVVDWIGTPAVSGTAGTQSVALSWAAVASGGAVTDYIVQYKRTVDSTWLTFADGTSTTPSATVTGLVAGTSYDFRVAAVNANGTGGYSATIARTPA